MFGALRIIWGRNCILFKHLPSGISAHACLEHRNHGSTIHILTGHFGSNGNTADLYSEGAGLEFRPEDRLY
jgi:hypothetical protein